MADFRVEAVDLLAAHGHRLLGEYRFDPAGYLAQARELLAAAGPAGLEEGPSWLPPQLERLRDFHLPVTAWSRPSADG